MTIFEAIKVLDNGGKVRERSWVPGIYVFKAPDGTYRFNTTGNMGQPLDFQLTGCGVLTMTEDAWEEFKAEDMEQTDEEIERSASIVLSSLIRNYEDNNVAAFLANYKQLICSKLYSGTDDTLEPSQANKSYSAYRTDSNKYAGVTWTRFLFSQLFYNYSDYIAHLKQKDIFKNGGYEIGYLMFRDLNLCMMAWRICLDTLLVNIKNGSFKNEINYNGKTYYIDPTQWFQLKDAKLRRHKDLTKSLTTFDIKYKAKNEDFPDVVKITIMPASYIADDPNATIMDYLFKISVATANGWEETTLLSERLVSLSNLKAYLTNTHIYNILMSTAKSTNNNAVIAAN